MENIAENQSSTQSAMPPQAPTTEMQAAMAELSQLAADPSALEARATQLGMGEQFKSMRDSMTAMQARAQEMMQKEDALKKQFDDLGQRAKSASNKMMGGIVAAVLMGGFIGFRAIKPDASMVKRTAGMVGGLLGGGVIGGLVGRMIFGSKIQNEAKDLTLQAQQIEVAKEQLASEAQNLQQPFIMELAGKLAETKKSQATATAQPAPRVTAPAASQETTVPPITAPAPPAAAPSSSSLMDDKDVSDQSIRLGDQSVTNTPAAVSQQSAGQNFVMRELNKPSAASQGVSQQSFAAGVQPKGVTTIQPRGDGFTDAAAKAQLATAGTTQNR